MEESRYTTGYERNTIRQSDRDVSVVRALELRTCKTELIAEQRKKMSIQYEDIICANARISISSNFRLIIRGEEKTCWQSEDYVVHRSAG